MDVSAAMLDHLRARARDLGLARRIQAVQADLDAGWPATGPVDLVWASNSLHHVKDPDQVLAGVFAALRPGGLLAVTETDSFRASCPMTSGRDSKHACRPSWPKRAPASYRICTPTGGRGGPRPVSPSRPGAPSTST